MQPATLNGLMAMTQTELPLSERAQHLLSRPTILVRVIDRGSLGCMFPMAPDEVIEEPDKGPLTSEERDKRYNDRLRAWLRAAPAETRIAHRLETERVKFHAVALAAIDPRLTVAEAERLGDAADEIYRGILEFSGLAKRPDAAPTSAPLSATDDERAV